MISSGFPRRSFLSLCVHFVIKLRSDYFIERLLLHHSISRFCLEILT
jgi:hypothetical protein